MCPQGLAGLGGDTHCLQLLHSFSHIHAHLQSPLGAVTESEQDTPPSIADNLHQLTRPSAQHRTLVIALLTSVDAAILLIAMHLHNFAVIASACVQ